MVDVLAVLTHLGLSLEIVAVLRMVFGCLYLRLLLKELVFVHDVQHLVPRELFEARRSLDVVVNALVRVLELLALLFVSTCLFR